MANDRDSPGVVCHTFGKVCRLQQYQSVPVWGPVALTLGRHVGKFRAHAEFVLRTQGDPPGPRSGVQKASAGADHPGKLMVVFK